MTNMKHYGLLFCFAICFISTVGADDQNAEAESDLKTISPDSTLEASCRCDNGFCENGTCKCKPEWGLFSSTRCEKCDCGKGSNCTFENTWALYVKVNCICKKGYEERSEKCIGTCNTNPCQNGGTCKTKGDEIECICVKPLSGEFCEKETDPCASVSCLNNGTCRNDGGKAKCDCKDQFTGEFCELDCKCDNGFCENGTCKCKPEWGLLSGRECRECGCGKGSNCTFESIIDGYVSMKTCVCKKGYEEISKTCLGTCSTNPCQNGGICLIKGDEIECLCEKLFSGELCEIEIDPCAHVVCENNGTCRNDDGMPKCDCKERFTGERCQIDKCSNFECRNGGTCHVMNGEARCKCKGPFRGNNCEIFRRSWCDNAQPPCLTSGGFCAWRDQTILCVCPENFVYDELIGCSECDCGIHGKCEFLNGKKTCFCTLGYTDIGGKCKRLDCDCGIHGTCKFVKGIKTCFCAPGFTDIGGICKDPCYNKPCQNGGTCFVQGEDFKCACKPPFFGNLCEKNNEYTKFEIIKWILLCVPILLILVFVISFFLLRKKMFRTWRNMLNPPIPTSLPLSSEVGYRTPPPL